MEKVICPKCLSMDCVGFDWISFEYDFKNFFVRKPEGICRDVAIEEAAQRYDKNKGKLFLPDRNVNWEYHLGQENLNQGSELTQILFDLKILSLEAWGRWKIVLRGAEREPIHFYFSNGRDAMVYARLRFGLNHGWEIHRIAEVAHYNSWAL